MDLPIPPADAPNLAALGSDAPRIRPVVIGLFRHGGRILVHEAHDPVKGGTFYRPLGGAIEFGETSAQALAREIREELGQAVTDLAFLGVLENLFTYRGRPGHEIVLVYDAAFADRRAYDRPEFAVVEPGQPPGRAVWRAPADFTPERPLYPQGLLELIAAHPSR